MLFELLGSQSISVNVRAGSRPGDAVGTIMGLTMEGFLGGASRSASGSAQGLSVHRQTPEGGAHRYHIIVASPVPGVYGMPGLQHKA